MNGEAVPQKTIRTFPSLSKEQDSSQNLLVLDKGDPKTSSLFHAATGPLVTGGADPAMALPPPPLPYGQFLALSPGGGDLCNGASEGAAPAAEGHFSHGC